MLRLHDTLTRTDKEVRPLDGKTLRFYCCGPTVYGPAHIGNFRTFVAQDVFRRVVEASGTPTLHVRNLTDVDDKTIRDSQKAGQSLTDFTEFWTTKFHADCAALNTLAPHIEPSAVKHIPHQIAMIEKLIARGHAYAAPDGSVYFRVSSFKDYGKLSHLEDRELRLGASEAASATDSDEYTKDSLTDFALWKARKPEDGPNFWPSPWGEGRPGWHLECSAMILEYLGEDFDLHSGGVDLIFPHHENEIAQSCCSTHGHFAAHWFHIAHLMVDGGKMSKSLGNLYTLEDLKARGYTASEVRYVLISGHYSAPLNFTMHSLDSARQALQKLSKTEHSLRTKAGATQPPSRDEVLKHGTAGIFADAWSTLLKDLNVPGALGGIFSKIKEADQTATDAATAKTNWLSLWFMLEAMGITLPLPESEVVADVPAEIQALAQQRWDAKAAKDWATADALRKQLEADGWLIKDSKEGFTVVKK
ncbi:MAG: cysteine--tRNA ligase [Verrucomicrobiaceae bacterium]|nr:cysteine--tRNA ligase [Verrucomicrobiaceae bacterium]